MQRDPSTSIPSPPDPIPSRSSEDTPFKDVPFKDVPFKDMVRREWNAVADHWGEESSWKIVEDSAQALNDRLVDLARLEPGDQVLDVGTGVGEPAVTAARKVGPAGRVVGIDLARRMIEVGRERVRRLGLEQVELMVGDAESLDLAPASFDAVLSRWTLMMVEDAGRALADQGALLVPGGRMAYALWGHPERVPMISIAMAAAGEIFPIPELPPEEPQHLWLRGLEVLGDLARGAGYRDVHTEVVDVTFRFPSRQAYAEFVLRMAGPLHVLYREAPEEMGRELLARIADASSPFVQSDGSVELVNENLMVAGTWP